MKKVKKALYIYITTLKNEQNNIIDLHKSY